MWLRPVGDTVMIFEHKSGSRVEITPVVLHAMRRFRQVRSNQTEAGGILLGRLIEGCGDIIIDEVTVPDRSDRRSRFNFFRSKRAAQARINAAWRESGQTRNYLGEWHTHPENCPTPSEHDIENWMRIVDRSLFEQDALVFVIVGRTATKAWILRRGENQASELQAASERESANEKGSQ